MKDILDKLRAKTSISDEESFRLAQSVSVKLTNHASDDEALTAIIYVADNWDRIPETTKELWGDVFETVGFYPYIKKLELNSCDLGYLLRTENHHSSYVDAYFHDGQKTLSDLLFSGKNVVASAPTSFGKSLLIEEIVASKKHKNIVIIQPTLALLDETRLKLTKYKDSYKIIVRTSQAIDEKKGNIFLLTAERVLEYNYLPKIDFLVLDEFYKLSNLRGDNRSNVLNNAFLKVMSNPGCQFYLLGPNVDDVSKEFLKKYNAEFYHTNYSLVTTEILDKFNEVKIRQGNKVNEEDLYKILYQQADQTLIFCASPPTARKLAFGFSKYLLSNNCHPNPTALPITEWLDANISWGWSLTRCLRLGIGIHDGSMPKHITSSTIKYFNTNRLKYLFCTNTIIEGVNTSAKNVIFYDDHIGKKEVDFFDYSNIKGRAGRLMEHYVGRVINLRKPPERKRISVDIPLVDQNPIDSEILINLDEGNVKEINDNKQRFLRFKSLDPELQLILKRNAVSVEGQLSIVKRLELDIRTPDGYGKIYWNRVDKNLHKYIKYILDLCWENLSNEEERKSFGPVDWIRNKIVSCCYGASIGELIENDINYHLKELAKKRLFDYKSLKEICAHFPDETQKIIDDAIERLFAFQKNWQQYRAPKWINVVDSLQKYVCKKNGKLAGDYSYVAEMLENNLVEPSLRILIEYGLPQNAVDQIQKVLRLQHHDLKQTSEDDLLIIIKNNIGIYEKILKEYEMDILKRII